MGIFKRQPPEWETNFRQIIDTYSVAAGQIFRLDPSTTSDHPADAESHKWAVGASVRGARDLYDKVIESHPKLDLLGMTKFNGYRGCAQSLYGVLLVFYDLAPWLEDRGSEHFSDALAISRVVQKDAETWMMYVQDTPAISLRDMKMANQYADVGHRMHVKSFEYRTATQAEIASWGAAPNGG
jgi:hypothetical protein